MKDLIKSWKKIAADYHKRANLITDERVAERLYYAANTFELCADQLEKLNDEPCPHKRMASKTTWRCIKCGKIL